MPTADIMLKMEKVIGKEGSLRSRYIGREKSSSMCFMHQLETLSFLSEHTVTLVAVTF